MKKIVLVLLFVLLFASSFVHAGETDLLKGVKEASPSNWLTDVPVWKSGKIDSISVKDGFILIDDARYRIDTLVSVYSSAGIKKSLHSLSSGDKVKYVLKAGNRDFIIKIIKE